MSLVWPSSKASSQSEASWKSPTGGAALVGGDEDAALREVHEDPRLLERELEREGHFGRGLGRGGRCRGSFGGLAVSCHALARIGNAPECFSRSAAAPDVRPGP